MKLTMSKGVSKRILALVAVPVISSVFAVQAAMADTTQLYSCSSGAASIFFQQATGQNNKFAYGNTNKIAAISPNAAGGNLGVIVTPPAGSFSNIYWYANPLSSHNGLQNLTVTLCFNNPNGTFFSSVPVPSSATVTSPAGQGWLLVRPSLPSNTVGKVLTQVTFQYSGLTTQPINLGRVVLNSHGVGTTLNTALLGCEAVNCP